MSIAFLNNERGIENQPFYQTKKKTEELLESIPIDYQLKKQKQKII